MTTATAALAELQTEYEMMKAFLSHEDPAALLKQKSV